MAWALMGLFDDGEVLESLLKVVEAGLLGTRTWERAALATFDEFLEDGDLQQDDDVCEMAWALMGLVDGGEVAVVIEAGLLDTRM